MDTRNYNKLVNQLEELGFGTSLKEQLKDMMRLPYDFNLLYDKGYGKTAVLACLHYSMNDETNRFELSSYRLSMGKIGKEPIHHTFYAGRYTVTLDEGHNLLNGRPVLNPAGWFMLDFKKDKFKDNFQYDKRAAWNDYHLEEVLSKFPIRELANPSDKQALIKSLEKGDLPEVTLQLKDREEKLFITPNLQFKSLKAYNSRMQRVSLTTLLQEERLTVQPHKAAQRLHH